MSNSVDLGFIDECESWRLESRFFPSKVGGKPAWLDLKNLPNSKELSCGICKDPCIFLCQVYAPYEDKDEAFHRTIYVFICKNPDCCKENSNKNFKVFRSQLTRMNEFFSPNAPIEQEDWDSDTKVEKWSKICNVCGIFSSSHCSKCKKVNYCCRIHQIWDWKNGHKNFCTSNENNSLSEKYLFPEFELYIEKEMSDDKHSSTKEELEKYKKLVESGGAGSLQSEENIDDDLLKMANNFEDKTFLKFKEKIKSYPEQVLRYHRNGNPLFISSSGQPENIPNCKECGSERQFEFQVMPQLLLDLREENTSKTIDWGILAIYTCKMSCKPRSKYIEEYIWKQDIKKEDIE